MNDDYLWDGTGEPDPEIEQLEQLLSVYKHQPRRLELPARPSPWFSPRLAAAAALVLMAIAGLWVFVNKGVEQPKQVAIDTNVNSPDDRPGVDEKTGPQQNPGEVVNNPGQNASPNAGVIAKDQNRRRGGPREVKRVEKVEPDGSNEFVEGLAYVDLETAKHLEKAQLLLRSLKNVSLEDDDYVVEARYDRDRSKAILQKNVLLRRNAQAKGNLPAEELLGSLEPILLDIANLPEKPSMDDLRLVKERIQRTEIIGTLQVYSAPILARGE